MPPEPVPADPGWDEDLAWLDRDPMTAAEREAWLDRVAESDDPPEPEEFEDFDPLTAEELAEVRQAAGDDLLAVEAATTGRRGPGQPGSARVFPGESASPAASFGAGMALDIESASAGLALAADAAVGDEDRFDGVSDSELLGVLCAWDRVEAHAAARKLAEIIMYATQLLDPAEAAAAGVRCWTCSLTKTPVPAARPPPAGAGPRRTIPAARAGRAAGHLPPDRQAARGLPGSLGGSP